MNRAQMTAPFAEEELRQFEGRGGKTMTFIEDETVMDRLDAGYGYGNWQLQVEEARIEGVVKVRLGVRENGEWAWYEDFGYPNQKGGDELKEAVSDGIRRCGRYLGIARDLYRKSTYEPGGALGPKAPQATTTKGNETLELLGRIQKSGKVEKGGSESYKADWREVPTGHAIGFRLNIDGEERAIPQVLVTGGIGEALYLGDPDILGKRVTVKGHLYNVKSPGRTAYYRLIVGEKPEHEFIETPYGRIPPAPEANPEGVSPLREDAIPVAEGQDVLPLDDEERALIAGGAP